MEHQIQADGNITVLEAAALQPGSVEVLLWDRVEQDLNIALLENPGTLATEEGHDDLLEGAAIAISHEDTETGIGSAILLGRAKEHIDRNRLNVPPRRQQPQQQHLHRVNHPRQSRVSHILSAKSRYQRRC